MLENKIRYNGNRSEIYLLAAELLLIEQSENFFVTIANAIQSFQNPEGLANKSYREDLQQYYENSYMLLNREQKVIALLFLSHIIHNY